MPDSSGKIRGITVPSVPWHGLSDDAAATLGLGSALSRPNNKCACSRFCGDVAERDDHPWAVCKRLPVHGETPTQKHDEGLRDADQMLWDKQTDEGPSALEKLRDKS